MLVSEIMLQQTPVVRVLPAWTRWMQRWPAPADLAAEAPGEAIRMWERLGYPRRALRLHAAAVAIVQRHGGTIWAESLGAQQGSCFHVRLPREAPASPAAAAAS